MQGCTSSFILLPTTHLALPGGSVSGTPEPRSLLVGHSEWPLGEGGARPLLYLAQDC